MPPIGCEPIGCESILASLRAPDVSSGQPPAVRLPFDAGSSTTRPSGQAARATCRERRRRLAAAPPTALQCVDTAARWPSRRGDETAEACVRRKPDATDRVSNRQRRLPAAAQTYSAEGRVTRVTLRRPTAFFYEQTGRRKTRRRCNDKERTKKLFRNSDCPRLASPKGRGIGVRKSCFVVTQAGGRKVQHVEDREDRQL